MIQTNAMNIDFQLADDLKHIGENHVVDLYDYERRSLIKSESLLRDQANEINRLVEENSKYRKVLVLLSQSDLPSELRDKVKEVIDVGHL